MKASPKRFLQFSLLASQNPVCASNTNDPFFIARSFHLVSTGAKYRVLYLLSETAASYSRRQMRQQQRYIRELSGEQIAVLGRPKSKHYQEEFIFPVEECPCSRVPPCLAVAGHVKFGAASLLQSLHCCYLTTL